MSELRVIPVTFGGEHTTVTECRIRHDWGQVYKFLDIDLPDVFEARFSNAPTGASIPQIGTDNMVEIPAQFFESGAPIYCYITLHDEETDGRTVYTVKTPISPSSDRTDAEPEPEEESIITQAIAALNTAVDTTSQKSQEASASADRAEHAAEGVEGYVESAQDSARQARAYSEVAISRANSASQSAATASEKASEAISSATTASQSALNAESASESAQASADASYQNAQTAYRYAQDSATSAGQAESYAGGAGIYASDAQTHSQTASQKALEASQSAQTATQAKTDAESAKTASETAQGLAESARNEAVTAKADAESARDEAQSIANGITGKVEQIDSNTERIESLEDDRYKPYPTDTASGSVASFPDGADCIPLKSCIVQVEPVQEGSGDPSPDNVRPISGFTGCEVQRTGKNLFDGEMENGDINSNTGENSGTSTSRYRSKNYIPIRSGSYYFKSPNRTGTVRVFFYDKDKNFVGFAAWSVNEVHTFINERIRYARFRFSTGKVDGDEQISINSPSSVTDYVPYVGQTYPVTFPSEAGTVYGAYVDVINGELVVDRAIVDLGTCNIKEYVDTGITNHLYSATLPDELPYYDNNVVLVHLKCSALKPIEIARPISFLKVLEPNTVAIRITYTDRVYIMSEIETVEAMKQSLDGVQLVYELAEPIHYPLTPTEIKTLLGQNNIWANTGDTEVEYRADTTLYIKRLTDSDTDMIADANIVSGQYFMVGNNLYRATANIASGASVIVGTNATKVSLATALNEINA